MVTVRKKPAPQAPVVAKARPRTVAAKGGSTATRAAAAKKPALTMNSDAASQRPLVAQAPEAKKAGVSKRQRLSKAFSRPLDKKLRKTALVRERFTLPEIEYAQLAVLKKRLSDRGTSAKKSELVRAGLLLIAALDDNALQALLAKVPPLD
jgi:hypothetical protein